MIEEPMRKVISLPVQKMLDFPAAVVVPEQSWLDTVKEICNTLDPLIGTLTGIVGLIAGIVGLFTLVKRRRRRKTLI